MTSILTYIWGIPILAALLLVVVPRNYRVIIRGIAVLATLISAVLAVKMFCDYGSAKPDDFGYRFVQQIPWVDALGISYHVGVDGLNVGLILMGAIVAFAAALCSFEIQSREKEFYILLLVMSGGILGAFASLDLFFFYFLHEFALIPTFIMIGVWGRGERKNYATFQITLYLSIGALIALIGLIALYLQSGAGTFDIPVLIKHAQSNPISADAQNFHLPAAALRLWDPGFALAVPFVGAARLWCCALANGDDPRWCAEKKFGLYGLIRIALPMLPVAAQHYAQLLAWLCVGNILYIGWVAMRQRDLNMLIGNSSVAHMGFIFLGIASLNLIGVGGAVLIMVAHGFLAALSFALNGYIYQQTGTLQMKELGGLCRRLPFIGTALLMAAMAGCGLPGFANFVGEVTVFFGAWKVFPTITVIALWGALVIGGVYMTRAIRTVLHGPLPEKWNGLSDASHVWRKLPYALLLASLFVFGFWPRLLTDKINPDAAKIVASAAVRPGSPQLAEANTGPEATSHQPLAIESK